MNNSTEVRIPNIGDFSEVEVIEVLVRPGDSVQPEDPLLTLESDKAAMDIPSPAQGVVKEINIKVGDRVSEGDLILSLAVQNRPATTAAAQTNTPPQPASTPGVNTDADMQAEVVVLGSGPGGYTAAFRAADLGKKTLLIERYPSLGGVCLNVGCIPSKALLHVARVMGEVKEIGQFGVEYGRPKIDLTRLRKWKNQVTGQLTRGLAGLARQRKVTVVQGIGQFLSSNRIRVDSGAGMKTIAFEQAIVAAGSQASRVPGLPQDPRIIDSTRALELEEVPGRLLVIGGGIIGLEMAAVYFRLGAKITVVEMLAGLVTGADPDLVKPLQRQIRQQYEHIYLNTTVTAIKAAKKGLTVTFEGPGAPQSESFDRVLVAVGRQPNGHKIGAVDAGITVDEQGFIPVDRQQRTNVPHIFAIGDIVGPPMLAHKASHEGKVAAEAAAGLKSSFDARVIPSVAYTDPEVAWVGTTETEARAQGVDYGKGVFPWAASGRSLSLGRKEGMTKLLFDKESNRVIGAGIVGPNAGDLIAEATLAIEMGCDAEDIGLTIHPHPTLSETIAFSAEAFAGTITDLYMPAGE